MSADKLAKNTPNASKFIFDEKRLHWASVVRGTNQQVKSELLLLKLIHLFAREVLLVKKLEIEETKTT